VVAGEVVAVVSGAGEAGGCRRLEEHGAAADRKKAGRICVSRRAERRRRCGIWGIFSDASRLYRVEPVVDY
jgi:hypothetical protein